MNPHQLFFLLLSTWCLGLPIYTLYSVNVVEEPMKPCPYDPSTSGIPCSRLRLEPRQNPIAAPWIPPVPWGLQYLNDREPAIDYGALHRAFLVWLHEIELVTDSLEPPPAQSKSDIESARLYQAEANSFKEAHKDDEADMFTPGLSPIRRLSMLAYAAALNTLTDDQAKWIERWHNWWKMMSVPLPHDTRSSADKLAAYVSYRNFGQIPNLPAFTRFEAAAIQSFYSGEPIFDIMFPARRFRLSA